MPATVSTKKSIIQQVSDASTSPTLIENDDSSQDGMTEHPTVDSPKYGHSTMNLFTKDIA